MTEETNTAAENGGQQGGTPAEPERRELLPLPGLAAIALYLAVLAGEVIYFVVGRHSPAQLLVFSVLLFAASGGLLMLFRWAWALALAAVLMLALYNSWIFSTAHLPPALVQGLLNWVFFLYMIRVEVRSKLR